jgi:hypothetical protein
MQRSIAVLGTCILLAWVSACSGPSLRGNVYRGSGLHFRVGPIPSSWQRLEVDHARLSFRDAALATTVLVNGRCGEASDDAPLPALTAHLFLSFTERETMSQGTVAMDGREALHTIMRAKLDGVPKLFDAYVLKKDGCVYDFVSISEPEQFAAARPAFETFVSGFHTLEGGQ